MGLLSPFLQQQQLLQQQPQLMMQPQQSPLAQLQPMAAQVRPSLGTRVNDMFNPGPDGTGGIFNSPLLQLGMSLLGNSRNGGDWSAVARDMQGIAQQRQQQALLRRQTRREDTQDQREGQVFQRQQSDWERQDQQYQRWENAVRAEQDPQRRQMLQAIGPQGYADFMGDERRMQFQHNEGELDRNAQLRAAQVRSANENSLGRYFQAMDAQTIGELNQSAAQLQAVGLPQLRQLRTTIQSAGQALVGRPIDYNDRIQLGRVFNGSSQDRQTLEVWRAQILGPALETLRGLGAMSEREMEAAVNSFSNPNMTLGAAMQLIDEKIATAERRVATAQATSQFFADAGGITGVRNPQGQDYATFLQQSLGATPGAGTTEQNSVPRGGYPQPNAAAVTELRRDTSAAARAEFDQTFGPGAASRALRQQTVGEGFRRASGGTR